MNNLTFYDTGEYRTRKTKRWLGWLTFCVMLLVGQMSLAQTGTIQIGSGAQTATGTAAIPVANYSFNYNQQIVTASEYGLGGGGVGSITKIRYKPTAVGTVTVWNDWTVYIGHTTKTEFTSTTDWVPLANLTQVFSGVVTTNPVAGDWFEITFTTPFNYTGGNIVIAIDENTAGWSSAPTWSAYTSTPNSGIYYRTDTVADNPNPATPPTATGLTAILPQIQFEGTFATCQLPTNLYVSNITDDSADLGWTEVNSATSWDIEWGLQGFTPTGTPTITGTTTNPHHLTGLTSNTKYDFYVRSDCGATDGTSLWAGPYTFKTFACLGATLDITSATGGGICAEGITTLAVTASGLGDDIYWYDAEFGGNLVGQGTSFETPFLTETTSYWAAEVLLDNELFTGQGNLSPTTLGSTTAGGITFVLNQTASILSFEARSTTAAGGAVTYALIDVDNGNSVLMTHSDTLPGGGTAAAPALYTVNLNFLNIPPGTYRLVKQSGAASAYMTGVFPYPLGTVGSITNGAGSATTTSTLYYHFFNITVEGVDVICASEREEVIATVHEIIDIDVTATDTEINPGDSTTLSVTSMNSNYTYEWTWDGGTATGASVTVSPTGISTTYTVTATDTVTGCQTQGQIEILSFNVGLCDDLEIATTTDGNICGPGTTTTLEATGNSGIADSQIFWYDAPTGGNKVGTGSPFTTPALTTTTSYYAAEVLTDGQGVGGTISTNYTAGGLTYFAATTGVGITFAVQNTNSVPVTLEGLDFYMDAGSNQSYQLWYNATTITGAPGIINAANGWVSIAGPLNVAPSGTTNGVYPVFTGIEFEIPANTTYRFVLTGTGAGNFTYYNASGTPNSFSSEGINLLVGDNSAGGTGNVGYSGQNPYTTGIATNPRFFHGALSFSSATILCESDREEVTATVYEIIDIDVTATETTIDAGDSTTLTASSTNSNYEYVWTWDGGTPLTGASVTVSPTEHTIFTVTATDTVTGCQTSEEIEILVYDMTLCDTIEILTTTDGSVCGEGTVTLSATASGDGDEIYWYDTPTGGNYLGQGATFTTPVLTETTSYWASEVYLDGGGGLLTGLGQPAPSQNINSTTNGGLFFTATESFTLIDVEVHSSTAAGGEVVIGLRDIDNGNIIIASTTITLPPGGSATAAIPVTVPLNFNITPGNYRLVKESGAGMLYNGATSGGAPGFPYLLSDVGTITGGATVTGTSTLYYFFYNWTISSAEVICESDREEVIATVHDIIGIDVTATETTIDAGDSTTLSVSSTNSNYTYAWTWDGGTATGTSVTVSPTIHTTYTVTATDTVTGCQVSEEIEILVYDLTLCDSIEILTTTDGSICNDGTVTLSATASGNGDEIYWYDAPTGGNLVGQGPTFETPELTETTSYWVSEVYLDSEIFTGQGNTSPTTLGSTTNGGITFVLNQTASILSFEARSTSAAGGAVTYALIDVDNGNSVLMTHNDILPGGGTGAAPVLYTVDLNFYNIPPGNYRLIKQSGAASAYMTGAFPYPLGTVGEVVNGAVSATGTSTLYYHFFNITIEQAATICESDREEVTATVHTIDIAATATTIDPGDSTTLTASSTNPNYTYEWTWDGGTATGASITVSPTDHTTYTVTATDSTDPTCQNSAEITIIVFSTAMCDDLEILSTTDGGICESGTTVLQATASGTGDEIYWYNAPTGGNLVGQGSSFTTPNLTATTSFWASEVLLSEGGGIVNMGPLDPSIGTSSVSNLTNHGMNFTVLTATTLTSVEIFPTAAIGTVGTIEIREGNAAQAGTIVETVSYTTTVMGTLASPVAQTVMLNVTLQPGNYTLTPGIGINLIRNTTGASYPYTSSVAVITGNTFNVNYWYWFYNWQFGSSLVLCESDREEVIATVVPASTTPAPTGDANQLVYAGTTLAGLDVTGTALTWYSDAALANEIPDTTLAYEGTYYVTQTIGYCEGAALAITVTLHCPTPNNLSTGTVTLNSAVLTWLGNGISSDIEWGLEGFTLGTGTEINDVSGTSYLLNGLTSDTFYDFYVRQDCETDGISLWGGPYTFFTGYCVVTSTSTNYGISNFTTTGGVLNINNSSGAGSYSNYTAQSVAQFVGGAPVQFTITSANSTAGMGVWIDWNNNMVFDAGEHIYNSAAYVASGSGSITVPAGTPLGNYRMRVVANFLSTNPTACDNLGSTSAIYGEAEDYTFMVIDPPACMPPIELTADVTATTANLGWTSTGTLFDIKWGLSGFDIDTQGTLIEGASNPYLLSELDPQTTYQYYVRRDCTVDDDGYSLWAGPFTFTTLCVPVSVLNENFDGVTAGTGVLPVCWSKIGTSAAYVNTTSPYSAPNNLYMYKSTNIDNYLVTPYLDNLADNTHWLRFRARTTSTSSTTLTVGYLTDVTDASTFVEIETITFVGTAYPTEDFIIFPWNLPVGAKHIAFRNNTNLRTIYLDDIRWEAAPTCMYPMSLNSSNISASSTILSWAGTGTLYDIEYGLSGFTPGTGTTIPGVSNPYTLTGLTGGATYQFYVRQDCGNNDYSTWSGPHTFIPGTYVGNIPTMLNANPQVDDVACATSFAINVPAGQQIASLSVQYVMTSANPAYTSHQRSVLYSSTLGMGEATVALPVGGEDFPGVIYYNRTVDFANGATGTVEFELKAWRTTGGTGCGTTLVFVEDGTWSLNATFEDIPSCPNPPADLDYTNITEDSVDLVWTSEETGTFQVKWGNVGFNIETEGTEISDIDAFSYTLSGLDSSIQYDFYVRRDCSTDDEDDFGEWVGPVRFNSGHCIPYATQGFYFTLFNTTNAVENVTYSYPGPALGTGYVNSTTMIITEDAGETFNFTSNYVGGASGLRIWVDWNNDFIFEDDEQVFFLAGGTGTKSGTITIPVGTPGGDYRMRVRAEQGATTTPPACGLITQGEALDFTLRVSCDEMATPTGLTTQQFTVGETLADLDVTGDNLVWYADEDLTIVLDPSTELVDATTYYVVSTNGDCMSEPLAVTAEDICSGFAAPTGDSTQQFEAGETLADLDVTGTGLVWYADEDLTIVLDPSTELVDATTYYVVSTNTDCQSDYLTVTVEQTSGVADFNNFGFRYYPNPVTDMMYLSANTPISNVTVINMLGQEVNVPANSDNTRLDMSGLPTGNYLIKVTIEGVSKMLKVVKK